MKKVLRNAEELQEALEAVLVVVVAKSVVLNFSKEFSAITTQVGLDLIPDDILSIVFEYAHDTEDSLVAETLSHVNHRFRKMVLRMPKLWTYISSKRDSSSRAAELLTRSVPQLLSVLIEGRSNLRKFDKQPKEEQKEEFAFLLNSFKISVVSPSHRLGSLKFHLDIGHRKGRDCSFLKLLRKSYGTLTFPVLQTLEIAYDKLSSEEETLPDSVQFCVNWEMPSLSTLKARNFIPAFRKQVVSRLKSCLLELDYNSGFYDGGGWDMYEVTRFIGSLANLEELEFILPFQPFPPSISASSFHNLQRLSLVFGLKGVTSCTNFFEAFECPNVLNVALDVVLPTGATPGASVCSLLGCFKNVRGVEDLTILMSLRHEPNREGPESFFDFELQDIAKKELFNKTKNLRVNYAMQRWAGTRMKDFSISVRRFAV